MVKISHKWNDEHIEHESDNENILLTNNIGGYCALSNKAMSRYQGSFFRDSDKFYKVLNNLILDKPVTEIVNHMNYIERKGSDFKERISMPHGQNALIYGIESKENRKLRVSLDCRAQHDSRTFGRYYKIEKNKDYILISFTKKTDKAEDSNPGKEEYKIFLVILFDKEDFNVENIETWKDEEYWFDKRRNSPPNGRSVFEAVDISNFNKAIFAFSTKKKKALATARLILENGNAIEDTNYKTFHVKKQRDKEKQFAKICAENALSSLMVKSENNGIYAGLYWFNQFWSRDTLISLRALMLQGHYGFAKDILIYYLNNIDDTGRLPNRVPSSDLGCADSIGWLAKRIEDLINLLEENRLLQKFLSYDELLFIKHKLEKSIFGILENHTFEDLIVNKPLETWMDTGVDNDTRGDARIEIQALQLCMYRVLQRLCKMTNDNSGRLIAKKFERELKEKTIRIFWNGTYLHDGRYDAVTRPNLFIAYYVYPELLSKHEWQRCFDHTLSKLWLEWGGLSTIDTEHHLFIDTDDGQINKAYHRGSSWFWINNLATICLKRAGNIRYRKHINIMTKASMHELLWGGFIGHHAEISSAKELQSSGCLTQAWSNAMMYELLSEK